MEQPPRRQGRVGEVDAGLGEAPVEGELHPLAHVHEGGVARVEHPVDALEVEGGGSEAGEVGALEARARLGLDDLPQHGRDGLQLLRRRRVAQAEAQRGAALAQAAEVLDAAAEQVVVAEDQLFAIDAPQPRRLDADPLHGAHEGAHLDHLADLERPVEHDGERGEDVLEDVAQGEPGDDAADTEAGHQGRDLDAEVVEGDEDGQGPDPDATEEAHEAERGEVRGLARAAARDLPLEGEAQHVVGPGDDLQQHDQDAETARGELRGGGQVEGGGAGRKPDGEQEEPSGALRQIEQQVVVARGRAGRQASQGTDGDPAQGEQAEEDAGGDGGGEQPAKRRVGEPERLRCETLHGGLLPTRGRRALPYPRGTGRPRRVATSRCTVEGT